MPSSITEIDELAMQSLVDGVDHVAAGAERKWGVGRLRLLVGDDLRLRFDQQATLFGQALEDRSLSDIRIHAPAMTRAWQALDAAATQLGQHPLAPVVWETVTPGGTIVAIVRSNEDAASVIRDNRAVQVWTLDEIGRVLDGFSQSIGKAKEVWPGALVEAVRHRLPLPEDGVPW